MPRTSLLTAAGWSVVTGVVTTLMGLVTSVVIARLLGPAQMGEYTYWTWIIAVLPVFFGFGLAPATMKFAAELLVADQRELAGSLVRSVMKVAVIVSSVLAIGLIAIGVTLDARAYLAISVLVAGLIALNGPTGVLGASVHAAMDYRFASKMAMVLNAGQLILFVIVLNADGGLPGLLLVMIAFAALSLLLQALWFRRAYGSERRAVPPELRDSFIKYCRSITALGLLDAVAWSRSEVFLLRLLSTTDQIAFYGLGYGISSRLIMAATLITHPMVPALSGLYRLNDTYRMNQIYNAALRYIALLTFPLALGGIFFARPLVTLLYGTGYDGVALPLAITAAASLAGAVMFACSAAIYAIGRPDFLVRLNVILALTDVLVALLLIPRYGATGAALANAIAPWGALIAAAFFLQRRYALRFPVLSTMKILAAAAVSVGVAWALVPATSVLSFIVIAVVAVIAYGVAVVVGRIFNHQEDREVFDKLGQRLPPSLRGFYGRAVSALT
jgi:O-antigen/teichoic acid export membrane protein